MALGLYYDYLLFARNCRMQCYSKLQLCLTFQYHIFLKSNVQIFTVLLTNLISHRTLLDNWLQLFCKIWNTAYTPCNFAAFTVFYYHCNNGYLLIQGFFCQRFHRFHNFLQSMVQNKVYPFPPPYIFFH